MVDSTNTQRPLALADLLRLVRSNIRVIVTTAWMCGVLAALLALSRPITYQAEGTFRDRGMASGGWKSGTASGGSGVLSAMLSGMGSGSDQELVSLFKSRQLAAPVIERMGLQVVVAEQKPLGALLGRFWDNGIAELAHLWGVKEPVLHAPQERLRVTDVHYSGEAPVTYRLHFVSPTHFRLDDAQGHESGIGQLALPFVSENISFLLHAETPQSLEGTSFHIEVLPIGPLAKAFASRLRIKPAEEREKVQKITFDYPDRHRASQFVNELMVAYQDYAKSENHRVASTQLEYLQSRQKESFADLQTFMAEHAAEVSRDLTSTGIFDTEKELEYLLQGRLECCTKLTEGDLELRRLQAVDAEDGGDYRALTAANGLPEPVVEALAQIRELSRRRDLLKVVLQNASSPSSVDSHSASLQGIDLKTAEEIFLTLNGQRNQIESEIKQNRFILDQLGNPAFEISSLAGSLTDPVGREIVARASTAVLSLHDSGNRSDREQERLREALGQQRAFLTAHLMQSNELLLLREEFLQGKTVALQKVLYDLIAQQLGISEQHLREYLNARMAHLKNERSLLESTLLELRQQMALLPTRWASEQIVLQRLKLNKTLVEEVGKFVESKNISNNLETMQSGAIDVALPPVLPKPPYVMLFGLLGAAMGAMVSSSIVVVRGLWNGVQVSSRNLLMEGQKVAGTLHCQGLQWIDLLRRICSQLVVDKGDDVLLLVGHGPDYSKELAQLLMQRGWKVLRISLTDRGRTDAKCLPGLLQVLEGQADQPFVRDNGVIFGGESPYLSELIRGERFSALLKGFHLTYDVVVIVSSTVADSAEAENLVAQFQKAAITVGHERLQDLVPLFQHPTLSFVFTDSMGA